MSEQLQETKETYVDVLRRAYIAAIETLTEIATNANAQAAAAEATTRIAAADAILMIRMPDWPIKTTGTWDTGGDRRQ